METFKSTKEVVHDLNLAVTKLQREEAIAKARSYFNHNDTSAHDEEVTLGAPQALYNILLGLIPRDDADEELEHVCHALDLVFSCSEEQLNSAFLDIGHDVLPLLVHVITKCFSGNTNNDTESKSLTHVLNILNKFNFVPMASLTMAKQPFLLSALLIVIKSDASDYVKALSTEVLADLAFHAENASLMVNRPGLMEAIMETGSSASDPDVIRQVIRVLQNISFSSAQEISKFSGYKLFQTLLSKVRAVDVETRQLAVGTIWNLASCQEMRTRLVFYYEGAVLEALVATMRDEDWELRHCSVCAIKKLIDDETAPRLGRCKNLLSNLSKAASDDDEIKVMISAAKALKNLSTRIESTMSCHEEYINSLVMSCLGRNDEVLTLIMDCIVSQASIAKNRDVMAIHAGIQEVIAIVITRGSQSDIEKAEVVLQDFSAANVENGMVVTDCLISAIVGLGSSSKRRSVTAEKYVLERIRLFSSHQQNVRILADADGLIEYLVLCARQTTDLEVREIVSQTLETLIRAWRIKDACHDKK